jgi:hypothetical protein
MIDYYPFKDKLKLRFEKKLIAGSFPLKVISFNVNEIGRIFEK